MSTESQSETGWDHVASEYASWLTDGDRNGKFFSELLASQILDHLSDLTGTRILDLGCGEGTLCRTLASRGANVVGVDSSRELLAIAGRHANPHAIQYRFGDIQQELPLDPFSMDIVTCNMVLMDIGDINSVFSQVHQVLRQAGTFLFSIVHPCFEFAVARNAMIELSFTPQKPYVESYVKEKILDRGFTATCRHFHRPIEEYLNGLIGAGFALARFTETSLSSAPKAMKRPSTIPEAYSSVANNIIVVGRKCDDRPAR